MKLTLCWGAGGARVGRGEAAILGLGSSHSPAWRWLSASWCGLLQWSSAVCSSFKSAWLWQLSSTPCAVFHAFTAMPFLESFLFTAPLCSLGLFSSVLPVSPIYTQSQSAQGTWYTTPFFSAGWGCFVWTRALRRVPRYLKVILIPRYLHIRSILSLTPLTWEGGGSAAPVLRAEGVWGVSWGSGQSSVWKMALMCWRFWCNLVGWQIFSALVARHWMTPDFVMLWWCELKTVNALSRFIAWPTPLLPVNWWFACCFTGLDSPQLVFMVRISPMYSYVCA